MRPPPNIVITNVATLNPGDAAILWGAIEILKKKYGPHTRITVFDKQATTAQKYFHWASFRQAIFSRQPRGWTTQTLHHKGYGHWVLRLRFARFVLAAWLLEHWLGALAHSITTREELEDIRLYLRADLVLSGGGTYLVENYGLSSAIMDYRFSIAIGKPHSFFTQTLGPFNNPNYRKAFKTVFQKAAVILLRDKRSMRHILDLGVAPDHIHLAADAAFVLARLDAQRTTTENHSRSADAPLRLAVSVRSMQFFHQQDGQTALGYFEGMTLATRIAVEEFGATVTFISTCQGIPEYWTDDADTAAAIYAMLPEAIRSHVDIDRGFRQPTEMVDAYGSFDAVIATRMHAAILSLCAGTPTLGVAYEFKMTELFKNIGMPELLLEVDTLSHSAIRACVTKLLSQRTQYRTSVKAAARKMHNDAWSAVAALPDMEPNREGFQQGGAERVVHAIDHSEDRVE